MPTFFARPHRQAPSPSRRRSSSYARTPVTQNKEPLEMTDKAEDSTPAKAA